MTPQQAAARFAAYVWYTNNRNAPPRVAQEEASRFARASWKAFLPVAHEGLGRLLLAVAGQPVSEKKRAIGRRVSGTKRPTQRPLAVAV